MQKEVELFEDYKKKYADLVEKNNSLKKIHASCLRRKRGRPYESDDEYFEEDEYDEGNQYINHIDDEFHNHNIMYYFTGGNDVEKLKKQFKAEDGPHLCIWISADLTHFVGHIKVPSAANHDKRIVKRDTDDTSGRNLTKHQNFTKHVPLNGGTVAIATEKITYKWGEKQQVGIFIEKPSIYNNTV